MIIFTETVHTLNSEETGCLLKSAVSYNKIAALLRKGVDVMIKDKDGYDVTKHLLLEYSLGRLVQGHCPEKKTIVIDILKEVMSDELLEEVVCSGGFEEYLNRKRKGLL